MITQRKKSNKRHNPVLEDAVWSLIILGFNQLENDSISKDH